MSSSNINEKVQDALKEGHSWEDIQSHLSKLDNPEVQSYLAGLKQASAPEQAPSASATQPEVKTGLLDYIEKNPADAAMYGAGAYALLQAPKIASKVADYRLKQRELGLKERSLNAYEAQVAKQGVSATPSTFNPQDELIQSVRQNEFEQQKAVQPTARELRDQIALQREQLKLEQDKLKHENFVRQNTWSPEEIALGRRITSPAEMQIAKTVIAQQAAKANPVAPTAPPANVAPAPVTPPVAPSPEGELTQWLKQSPVAPIEPANVISTGPTPQAAAAPIEKAAEVKQVTQPEKPVSKVKKPVDPSEVGLTKEQIGMKRYLESNYGGGEVGAKTYAKVGEILGYTPAYEPGKGGGLNPEENKIIKGYRKENIAGPKVNLDKEMKRGLKGGVGVAALMAIPGFADAAQRKDYGRMADIASDFVVLPFAGSTELGVSTLGEKQKKAFENAQKLGSPYRSVPPR